MTKTAHITHSIKAALIAFVCDGDRAHSLLSKLLRRFLTAEKLEALHSVEFY